MSYEVQSSQKKMSVAPDNYDFLLSAGYLHSFNEIVKIYNIKVRRFPTNVMAGMFGFEKATFFQTPEAEKEVPKVKF